MEKWLMLALLLPETQRMTAELKAEEDYYKLAHVAYRLSPVWLDEAIGRIQRHEHLDLAGIRVEQTLTVVAELRQTVAAAHADLTSLELKSLPKDVFDYWNARVVALRRFLEPETGSLDRACKALVLLQNVLEKERRADLKTAMQARQLFEELRQDTQCILYLLDEVPYCPKLIWCLIDLQRDQNACTEILRSHHAVIRKGD
jgi:hypothetical protein